MRINRQSQRRDLAGNLVGPSLAGFANGAGVCINYFFDTSRLGCRAWGLRTASSSSVMIVRSIAVR